LVSTGKWEDFTRGISPAVLRKLHMTKWSSFLWCPSRSGVLTKLEAVLKIDYLKML
jgi:hypothetical protein